MKMYRLIFSCLFSVLLGVHLNAQISEGGLPYSMSLTGLKSSTSLPQVSLKKLDTDKLNKEDSLNSGPFRIGVFVDSIIDVKVNGKTDIIPGKGKIWRLRIGSVNAKSIQLIFKTYVIPQGAKLFLYNDNLSLIAGAFSKNNMRKDSAFVLADFKGNHVILEYFEPDNPEFEGEIIIGSIAQAYKDILSKEESSASSYININCPEGKDLQLQKHSVCMISFKSGRSSYLCSGSLINNTRQDGTPYFLTANHCINTSSEASTLVAYLNYEYEGCNISDATPVTSYKTLSGSSLLTTATASDYSLLILQNTPQATAQPYYAGWNAYDSAAFNVAGIHHPEGYAKKLSLEIDSVANYPYIIPWSGSNYTPASTHWEVNFDVGVTGGGSSGSPLYNKRKQIIGQLHGGDDIYDYYGKFSYSWTYSGNYPTVKSYLDPDNTGTLSLGGYSPDNNPPDAFFVTSSQLCMNDPVKLVDYSAFPHERTWTILPSDGVTYLDGTSQTSAEPVVNFSTEGTYTIELDVNNSGGTDSKQESIEAGKIISIEATLLSNEAICLCNSNTLRLTATGAKNYSWDVPDAYFDKVVLNKSAGDTVLANVLLDIQADSSVTPGIIRIIGVQGGCADTIFYMQTFKKPGNDDIRNAYLLNYGTSNYFSNECATIEENEPVPPCTSCTSQLSWCDEYGTGDSIVERSVWFKFIPGNSSNISITSAGFDNEIALYAADSYEDILSNNYTLLAANDDQSLSNAYPIIRSVPVVSGQSYWIQVDGSAGGTVGDFNITINTLTAISTSKEQGKSVIVYPQPAQDYVYIQDDSFIGMPLQLSVYSFTGALIHSETIACGDGIIRLNTSAWDTGVYVARINTEVVSYIARIVKY